MEYEDGHRPSQIGTRILQLRGLEAERVSRIHPVLACCFQCRSCGVCFFSWRQVELALWLLSYTLRLYASLESC